MQERHVTTINAVSFKCQAFKGFRLIFDISRN